MLLIFVSEEVEVIPISPFLLNLHLIVVGVPNSKHVSTTHVGNCKT